jgi:hypothetical protein
MYIWLFTYVLRKNYTKKLTDYVTRGQDSLDAGRSAYLIGEQKGSKSRTHDIDDNVFEELLLLREKLNSFLNYIFILLYSGALGSVVVKALCYKPEGRGFDTR